MNDIVITAQAIQTYAQGAGIAIAGVAGLYAVYKIYRLAVWFFTSTAFFTTALFAVTGTAAFGVGDLVQYFGRSTAHYSYATDEKVRAVMDANRPLLPISAVLPTIACSILGAAWASDNHNRRSKPAVAAGVLPKE